MMYTHPLFKLFWSLVAIDMTPLLWSWQWKWPWNHYYHQQSN